VDTGLDENETELRVFILAVDLEMFSYGNSLLHKVPEVFGNAWCETGGLEDTEDFVTGDELHLGDTLGITQLNTDLGRSQALASELVDLLADILGGRLAP